MSIKPILFNADMVRAILDGRKTVTRRVVKAPPYYPHFYKLHDNTDGALSGTRNRLYAGFYKDEQIFYIDGKKLVDAVYYQAPYQPGDILYVRETWQYLYELDGNEQIIEGIGKYYYAATDALPFDTYIDSMGVSHERVPWKPSIHMPKEAARIWLKVKNVRVERLQEITEEQARVEGAIPFCLSVDSEDTPENERTWHEVGPALPDFIQIWDSTIKKSDLDRYGWDANPWVWVIEFERCEKPGD